MATRSRLTKATLDRLEARASELTAQARGIGRQETGAFAVRDARDYAFLWLQAWHATLLEEQVADAKDPEEETILDPVQVKGLYTQEDLVEAAMVWVVELIGWDEIIGSYVVVLGTSRGGPRKGKPEEIVFIRVAEDGVDRKTVAAIRDEENKIWIDSSLLEHDPITEEEE